MTGPEFFQTRMGQTFYEHTMPQLVKAVNRLADSAVQRRICRDDLIEQIGSIHEGDVIRVVPEHECEFYTAEPRKP